MKKSAKSKGLMGISTLIIFIAIILVAAAAATVIILTTGHLRTESIKTQSKAKKGVSQTASIIDVTVTDGSDGDIEDFEVIIRLGPGSDSIDLNDSLLVVTTPSWSQEMEYNGSGTTAVGSISFWVEYVVQGPNYALGYVTRGDLVRLRFHADSAVLASKKLKFKFIPKIGPITEINTVTPNIIKDVKLTLYPFS